MLFAAGLHGYFVTRAVLWQRALLVAAGLLLVKPGLISDMIGAGLGLAVAGVQNSGASGDARSGASRERVAPVGDPLAIVTALFAWRVQR